MQVERKKREASADEKRKTREDSSERKRKPRGESPLKVISSDSNIYKVTWLIPKARAVTGEGAYWRVPSPI